MKSEGCRYFKRSEVFAMGNFEIYFINSVSSVRDSINNEMAEIPWGRDSYKRIDNREEIKDNIYEKANLYVDSP